MPDASDTPVVLLWDGATTIGRTTARRLRDAGFRPVVYAPDDGVQVTPAPPADTHGDGAAPHDAVPTVDVPADAGAQAVIDRVVEAHGRLDGLVNFFVPTPEADATAVMAYPERLRARVDAASDAIAEHAETGGIINHCFLPSMYAGTALERSLPALKGAVTGVTRTACLDSARDAVRVNTLQTGLIDAPETRAFATDVAEDVDVPTGRWITPREVAEYVTFLLDEGTYITGQTLVLDGGVTSGITGT